jgi:hypothetical protein
MGGHKKRAKRVPMFQATRPGARKTTWCVKYGGCPISLKDEFLINFRAYKRKTTPFLAGILNFYAGKLEKSDLLDSPRRRAPGPLPAANSRSVKRYTP